MESLGVCVAFFMKGAHCPMMRVEDCLMESLGVHWKELSSSSQPGTHEELTFIWWREEYWYNSYNDTIDTLFMHTWYITLIRSMQKFCSTWDLSKEGWKLEQQSQNIWPRRTNPTICLKQMYLPFRLFSSLVAMKLPHLCNNDTSLSYLSPVHFCTVLTFCKGSFCGY